jgi:hypothetical protein
MVPLAAARRKRSYGAMFPSWWSWWTVSNQGSGFQIPGVLARCATAGQIISSSAQSGSPPLLT